MESSAEAHRPSWIAGAEQKKCPGCGCEGKGCRLALGALQTHSGPSGAGGRGFGCSSLAMAALAGLSGLQDKPQDPLVLVFLSITTG